MECASSVYLYRFYSIVIFYRIHAFNCFSDCRFNTTLLFLVKPNRLALKKWSHPPDFACRIWRNTQKLRRESDLQPVQQSVFPYTCHFGQFSNIAPAICCFVKGLSGVALDCTEIKCFFDSTPYINWAEGNFPQAGHILILRFCTPGSHYLALPRQFCIALLRREYRCAPLPGSRPVYNMHLHLYPFICFIMI